MKASGYRVVVIGASSLLGKELLAVIEERGLPVSSLKMVEGEGPEPDLPSIDLGGRARQMIEHEAEIPEDFDFVFVAAPHERLGSWHEHLRSDEPSNPRTVIEMSSRTPGASNADVCVPFLDRLVSAGRDGRTGSEPGVIVSPHSATIMISALMLRLAARFPLRRAVAQLFSPASEIGPRAIAELQKQTVNLLSFQKAPREIFGEQLAFNLLPRLATPAKESEPLEDRIRTQLQNYLVGRVPLPALRLFQVPVFHSMALSLYVETQERVAPADLVASLEGPPLKIRRASQKPPSQVEAAGSNEILVDAIEPDAACPAGIWLWAVADNLRLAAINAAQIAEGLVERRQPLNLHR
jgi:aspartate-semialdehyde dehydrogenase